MRQFLADLGLLPKRHEDNVPPINAQIADLYEKVQRNDERLTLLEERLQVYELSVQESNHRVAVH